MVVVVKASRDNGGGYDCCEYDNVTIIISMVWSGMEIAVKTT